MQSLAQEDMRHMDFKSAWLVTAQATKNLRMIIGSRKGKHRQQVSEMRTRLLPFGQNQRAILPNDITNNSV